MIVFDFCLWNCTNRTKYSKMHILFCFCVYFIDNKKQANILLSNLCQKKKHINETSKMLFINKNDILHIYNWSFCELFTYLNSIIWQFFLILVMLLMGHCTDKSVNYVKFQLNMILLSKITIITHRYLA